MITFKVHDINKMNASLKPFLDFLKSNAICDDDVFYSRLVSCELITNVLRHLGEAANFEGCISGENIVISVSSDSTSDIGAPATLPDVFAESGRGLYIVKTVSCGNIFYDGHAVKVYLKKH